MSVSGQIDHRRTDLAPAERKVAEIVLSDPEAVAFGTVADLARRAGTSGATVVRLAAKLGYDGFPGLQGAVREEMALRLRPAAERIRRPEPGDALSRTLAVELENLTTTLESVDRSDLAAAVKLLAQAQAQARGRVLVLSGDASHGIAITFATELSMLRPGVEHVAGSPVRVARVLAQTGPADVVVVLDFSRYDRWVLDATGRASTRGAQVLALTDHRLSPLAGTARLAFTVAAAGAGPFESHVGMLALINVLVAGVADRLRRSATERLDRLEAAWTEAGALVD
ncbi:MAG: MurR/RpiR family transcriptional regulator [Acidimicrobiia bacterium]